MELFTGAVETQSAFEGAGLFALGFKRNVVLDGKRPQRREQWDFIVVTGMRVSDYDIYAQ